jgi:hypothetical protein
VRGTYLFFVIVCLTLLLPAEEIQLTDGSKVVGKVTAIDGNTFHVKTSYGEIEVPRSKIVSIQFPENSPAKEGAGGDTSEARPINESLDGVLYSNRTAHFQVSMPPGWTIAPELRKTKDIVAALKSPDQAHFFIVTPEQFAGDLNTYRVLAEAQFQSKFEEYKKVSESEAKLDGRNGLRLVWEGKAPNTNVTLKFLVYIIPYENRMVRLSLFTLEPLFEEAVPTFEKIAASYHSTSNTPIAGVYRPADLLLAGN